MRGEKGPVPPGEGEKGEKISPLPRRKKNKKTGTMPSLFLRGGSLVAGPINTERKPILVWGGG